MLLPEDYRPRKGGRFYYSNEGVNLGNFPIETVMNTYYDQAIIRRENDVSVATVLDRSIALGLGPESYSFWYRDGALERIKEQILKGLFEGYGLVDFKQTVVAEREI